MRRLLLLMIFILANLAIADTVPQGQATPAPAGVYGFTFVRLDIEKQKAPKKQAKARKRAARKKATKSNRSGKGEK